MKLRLVFMIFVVFLAACGAAGGNDVTTTESGLQYEILEEGTGEIPEPGATVRVHYTGTLEDGTQFDSSEGRDPISFVLGQGGVIPGWDEGIGLIKEGTSARFTIPAELGYGAAGSPPTIPANATLIFEVELVEVIQPPKPVAVDEDDFTTTDSGLMYYDIEAGSGEMPEEGQPVRVNFTAWLEDGLLLGSTHEQGGPISFTPGGGEVLPGWEEGVMTMQVGGVRQLVLPPELAFGDAPPGGAIPPNATIITELELVEILVAGPADPTEVAEEDFTETESGLKYYDIVEGDGDVPEDGQTVVVRYTGWLEDGTKFDSSYDRGQTFDVILGSGGVIPGWEEGLSTMTVGSTRQLIIPPTLAYGVDGALGIIPPDATLVFEVELVEIK